MLNGVWTIATRGGDHKYATLTNGQVQEMLDKILADIKESYYDPNFHGVDLDKQFEHDRQLITSAKSQDEALLYVAAAVESLGDSHTHFKPPVRPYAVDYGWTMQAVGDSACYLTHVRPNSDAAAKGLQAGERVMSIILPRFPAVRVSFKAALLGRCGKQSDRNGKGHTRAGDGHSQ